MYRANHDKHDSPAVCGSFITPTKVYKTHNVPVAAVLQNRLCLFASKNRQINPLGTLKTMNACSAAAVVLFTSISLQGAITISSISPTPLAPQPYGTPVTFTVSATDTNQGPVAFRFEVAYEKAAPVVCRNFDIGTLTAGVWTAQPFTYAHLGPEGTYTIIVTAKDFSSGQTATQSMSYALTSPVSGGNLTVLPTENPVVALAAIPGCPVGSSVRAYFYDVAAPAPSFTEFMPCNGQLSNSVYLGGMYPNTLYKVGYEIKTAGTTRSGGSTATFKSRALSTKYLFPVATAIQPATPQADTAEDILLYSNLNPSPGGSLYPPTATDLAGNVIWYYATNDNNLLLTRPLAGGHFFILGTGTAWSNHATDPLQIVRKVDLAGNVEAETNIGLLQQQLLALGATDMQSCGNIPIPAPVGSACLIAFSHDAILLPNGDWVMIGSIEKIFPPGTQGSPTGLNVDILGDSVIVLDSSLNPLWYWDAFQHDGGGTQLDINRTAVLRETCAPGQGGCPATFLVGTPGVNTYANDWMHSNSLYYNPTNGSILVSVRHQDWVISIDFGNGHGTSNVLWRLGLDGDFTFNNISNDPYPWFTHQHNASIATTGVYTVFDNGNTRVEQLGGNSRGVALNVDVSTMTVTPVLLQDLGYYALAVGSAQYLPNGNYHFESSYVAPYMYTYSEEYFPTVGAVSGTQVYNLQVSVPSYRSFRMTDLYSPPAN
jgi:arylsulfate sulfotransferase